MTGIVEIQLQRLRSLPGPTASWKSRLDAKAKEWLAEGRLRSGLWRAAAEAGDPARAAENPLATMILEGRFKPGEGDQGLGEQGRPHHRRRKASRRLPLSPRANRGRANGSRFTAAAVMRSAPANSITSVTAPSTT